MARSGSEQLLDLRVAFWKQSGDTYLLMRVVKLCMLPAAAMMREVSAHAEILWATKKRCGYVQRLKHMNSANWPPLSHVPPDRKACQSTVAFPCIGVHCVKLQAFVSWL